jgi:hypothetical protein
MTHRKAKSRSPNPRGRASRNTPNGSLSSASTTSQSDSSSAATLDIMSNTFVERRKHNAHSLEIPDEDSADATARLMGRDNFSLDTPVPSFKPEKDGHGEDAAGAGAGAKGFFELPEQDRKNFMLLVLLYFLQGIPMGLATGSVPFLLKSHLSYAQIGIYSLASYPYSLKLLWSPIVDAVWSKKVGRRKSWILPIQMMSGLGMLWLGGHAESMMVKAGADNGAGVWGFTGWWFALVFMCATQDIAVDGESLQMGELLFGVDCPSRVGRTLLTRLFFCFAQAGPSRCFLRAIYPTRVRRRPSASPEANSFHIPFSSPSPPPTLPTNTFAPRLFPPDY